jgi:hypothetical protein
MALIILEGLDRVGKSSVAQMFESQGYKYVHMSAPPKGQTADLFLDEMVELTASAAAQDIVLDRSYYGETIWSKIYNREPLIDELGLEVLRELEDSVGTTRILMHDLNSEGHWQRCVDNKEPLTKAQFVKARSLYSGMADKYGFERKTLKDFPNAEQPLPSDKSSKPIVPSEQVSEASSAANEARSNKDKILSKSKEQLKLERANIINEVLEKRIIKGKGPMYDDVERSVRHFLNIELGKILGTATATPGLSNEEIELLKFFCKRLKDKETEQ